MKRCKNCVLWRPHKGTEPTMPRTKSHACMLRLLEVQQGEEKILRPTMLPRVVWAGQEIETKKGPHHGKRTGPSFVCEHFVGKRPPLLRAKPTRETLPPQTVNVVDRANEIVEDVSKRDTDLAGDDRQHHTDSAA